MNYQLQVLRYGVTNKHGPHLDGLERVCTVVMYLVGKYKLFMVRL